MFKIIIRLGYTVSQEIVEGGFDQAIYRYKKHFLLYNCFRLSISPRTDDCKKNTGFLTKGDYETHPIINSILGYFLLCGSRISWEYIC